MNKAYKYTLSSGEKKEITFDVGVHRLAVSNANGEDGGTGAVYTAGDNIQISDENVISATNTTYTAGSGITISEENVISATVDYSTGEKFVGIDENGYKLYEKSYSLSNVSGTQTVNLDLTTKAEGVYLITGFGKDSSKNIYPLTNNEKINIDFTETTAVITVESGLTLTTLNFRIQYYYAQMWLEKSANDTEQLYIYGFNPHNDGTIQYQTDCFLACKRNYNPSQGINTQSGVVISLTSQTDNLKITRNYNPRTYYRSTDIEYTHNGHTIYYNLIDNNTDIYAFSTASLQTAVSNGLPTFDNVNDLLDAFIDLYF